MSIILRIAKRLRHLPSLERFDLLWNVLRAPFHRALNMGRRGVLVVVGDCAPVRIPAEFTGGDWSAYEPENIAAAKDWCRNHPQGLFIDVGCAFGIYSAVALFADPSVEVIAFDSNLSCLAATRRVCQYVSGNRLQFVHALLDEASMTATGLADAMRQTSEALSAPDAPRGDPGTTRYICLTSEGIQLIPKYSLDDLFAHEPIEGRYVLIKCDIEGAELKFLHGAKNVLSRCHADLLLSVHPQTLTDYGASPRDVRTFLDDLGYRVSILAIDHEEHWWCEAPADSTVRSDDCEPTRALTGTDSAYEQGRVGERVKMNRQV